ncbi:hypothetical protein [Chlamydia trachomatis]|uniref:hypothetical protein n=1 Tax=Chlamydia trachomatis TaxID=813 RepID=UPI00038DC654|nr:hypothetical protein [Chlamydia trachomatis]AGT72767.1 hypothetical protein O180_02560 [Chlamydia trachomatis]
MKESALLPLLKKKKGFFLSILDLTQVEASLSPENLIKVLRQKKTLLSCIEKVDHQIKKFRDSFSLALPQEVQEELEEIRSVIQRILETDKKNYCIRKRELRTYAKNRHL